MTEDPLLFRIVAVGPMPEEGMLPPEVVANIKVAPHLLRGDEGRQLLLGLLIGAGENVFERVKENGWTGERKPERKPIKKKRKRKKKYRAG